MGHEVARLRSLVRDPEPILRMGFLASTPVGPTKKHRTTPDPYAAKVGSRIRALREEADISFDAFVGETGLGRGYVSELERGLVVPTIRTLAKVARTLEVTVADLVLDDSKRAEIYEATRSMTERELAALLKTIGEE